MQSQFESMSLVAQAYEQALRVDAARTRSALTAETGQSDDRSVVGRSRRAAGAGAVRIRQRFASTGGARRLVFMGR